VVQRAHPDVVLLALPPRHPAFRKTVDHTPDLLFASHPPIFGSVARAIKTGSSDARHDQEVVCAWITAYPDTIFTRVPWQASDNAA
jgi:hypothetical protein